MPIHHIPTSCARDSSNSVYQHTHTHTNTHIQRESSKNYSNICNLSSHYWITQKSMIRTRVTRVFEQTNNTETTLLCEFLRRHHLNDITVY